MKRVFSYYPYKGMKLDDYPFKIKTSWEYNLKELLNKENIEIHTNDLCDIKKIEGALVFDNMFYNNIDIMWDLYNNKKLDSSVYINYEPITGHAKNHDEIGMKHLSNIFNKIVTFDDDIVDGKKFIKGNIANFFGSEMPYKDDFKKRKFLTMITNNTNVNSIIEEMNYHNNTYYYNETNIVDDPNHSVYRERENAVKFFAEKCPDDFDLYGELWPDEYSKVLKGTISRKEKQKVLSNYKFAFSYDSYTNQNGYISEKIFDCFMAKVVPIYLGADNVYDYIPKDCFINKKDFNTYDELYDFLINMNGKTYNKYISNIEKYLKSDKYKNTFSSKASALVLKDSLLTKGKIDYKKAYDSLMYFTNKRDELFKIDYHLGHIHYDKKQISVEFEYSKYRKNANFRIESNGLDEDKVLHLKDCDSFVEYFSYNKPHLYIKIYDLDKNKYIDLYSNDPVTSVEYGLLNKEKDKIIYYNYVCLNPVGKLIYVLLHNRDKLFKKFSK